ncbi:hypothetical protein E8E14_010396 [Neopestalotiopsis sp. 37M]|nr:hypothetical protein E8E14_010396 [Neopestalotiopsis sp. 37M]
MAYEAIEPSQVNRLRIRPADTSYPDLELPPNHIRLLDLDAAPSGNHTAQLTGVLRIEKLTNLSTYNTLSYQWAAKESEGATIYCLPHNVELRITTNCAQALRFIRREFASAGPVTIWVDAVCINQNNKKEKESQIPFMGKIYSQAETGYIWLEGDNEHCRLAVDELRLRSVVRKRLPLAYLAAESGERSKLELDRLRHRLLDDVSARARLDKGAHRKFTASRNARLRVLFEHGWLSRMWTFQELILSRNPVIVFGDSIIPWEDLVNAVRITPEQADGRVHWERLIDLWLDFPRRRHTGQAPLQPNEMNAAVEFEHSVAAELYTFRSLIASSPQSLGVQPWHHIMFRCGSTSVRIFRRGLDPIVVQLTWITGFVFLEKSLRLNFGASQFLPILGIAALILFGIVTAYYYAKLSMWELMYGIDYSIRQIFFEDDRLRLRPRQESSRSFKVVVLDAIWTTVRMRESSDDHDMAFALVAILEACGMVTPPLEYSQSIETTYQAFFQGILSWEPRALQMIVDASVECQSNGAWPSWLPDWRMPETNNWLFKESGTKHSWTPDFPRLCRQPAIIGNGLFVSGKRVDKIVECFHFTAVNFNDHCHHTADLTTLIRFIQSVYSREAYTMRLRCRGAILAVLEGLLLESKPTTGTSFYYDPSDGTQQETENFLPGIQAPFDFTMHEKDFYDYKRLHNLALDVWERNDSAAQRDPKLDLEELISKIENDDAVIKFIMRITNQIVQEKRCIFILSSGKVGSGPQFAAAGDEILSIPGVSKHLVGRWKERQQTYRLIGPGLVHNTVANIWEENVSYEEFVFE